MNASIATPQEPLRTAPLALWRVAATFLGVLHTMFGPPETIAAKGVLTQKPYALLLSWLRCGEAMMRRLLLLEAQACAKPNTRPLLRAARKRERRPMSFEADAPETWRVSFRCFMERRRPAGMRRAMPKARTLRVSRQDRCSYENFPPVKFHNAWPLAERYEALLRVFNDPTGYARRVSRRLHATPHRAAELRRAPPEAEHRIDRFSDFLSAEARPPPSPDSS